MLEKKPAQTLLKDKTLLKFRSAHAVLAGVFPPALLPRNLAGCAFSCALQTTDHFLFLLQEGILQDSTSSCLQESTAGS